MVKSFKIYRFDDRLTMWSVKSGGVSKAFVYSIIVLRLYAWCVHKNFCFIFFWILRVCDFQVEDIAMHVNNQEIKECVDLRACAYTNWYRKFRKITFDSVCIPLPEEIVKYFLHEIIILPKECYSDDGEKDSFGDENVAAGSNNDDDDEDEDEAVVSD